MHDKDDVLELELELELEKPPADDKDDGEDDEIDEFFCDFNSIFFMAFSRFCLRHLARRFLNHTLKIKKTN